MRKDVFLFLCLFTGLCFAGANQVYQTQAANNERESERQVYIYWSNPKILRAKFLLVSETLSRDKEAMLEGNISTGEVRYTGKSGSFTVFYFDRTTRGGWQELGRAIPEKGLKVNKARRPNCPVMFWLEEKSYNLFTLFESTTREVCVGWSTNDLVLRKEKEGKNNGRQN